jgi:hypothetical protein
LADFNAFFETSIVRHYAPDMTSVLKYRRTGNLRFTLRFKQTI